MKVIIYTSKDCPACVRTKEFFDRRGVTYESVDLTANDSALSYVNQLGVRQVPLVEVLDEEGLRVDFWTGLNVPNIQRTINNIKAYQ